MDNSVVLGLVPACAFSQYPVLEANKHQTETENEEEFVGMEPTTPRVGDAHPQCLILTGGLWCLGHF